MTEESPIQNPNGEKELVKLTPEELDEYTALSPDNPKLLEWMASKGFEFGDGEIDVIVGGEKRKMVTLRDDFGTLLPKS